MTRAGAEMVLRNRSVAGSFILRESSVRGRYAISIFSNPHRIIHYQCLEDIAGGNGCALVYDGDDGTLPIRWFSGWTALVEYYSIHPVNSETPLLVTNT